MNLLLWFHDEITVKFPLGPFLVKLNTLTGSWHSFGTQILAGLAIMLEAILQDFALKHYKFNQDNAPLKVLFLLMKRHRVILSSSQGYAGLSMSVKSENSLHFSLKKQSSLQVIQHRVRGSVHEYLRSINVVQSTSVIISEIKHRLLLFRLNKQLLAEACKFIRSWNSSSSDVKMLTCCRYVFKSRIKIVLKLQSQELGANLFFPSCA